MTRIHRILLAGLTAGGMTWCAAAQSPAARIGLVRASTLPDAEPIARAAPPDANQYFEDNRPAGSGGIVQAGNSSSAPSNGSFFSKAWTNIKSWNGGDSQAVDKGLMPLSPATMPQFNQGGRGTVPPTNQPARTGTGPQTQTGFRPQPQTSRYNGQPVMAGPNGTGAAPPNIAGKPAFNWYGWGSSVPGANPLAPQGQYPQASPNWMVQTGATPGAIPLTGVPATAVVAGPGPGPMPAPTSAVPSGSGPVNLPTPAMSYPAPPTASPAAPTSVAPTAPVATAPQLTTIPTITPPPLAPTPNPVLFPSFPTPAPTPPTDEPTWSPAARRPAIEQTSGTGTGTGNGPLIHAVAHETDEPSWHTAKSTMPRLIPVPGKVTEPKPTLPDLSGGGLPAAIPEIEMPTGVPINPNRAPIANPPAAAPVATPQPMAWQSPARDPARPKFVEPAPSGQTYAPPPIAAQPAATGNPTRKVEQPQPWAKANPQPAPRPQARPASWPTRPASNGDPLAAPPPEAPQPREIVLTASKPILQLEAMMSQACIRHATILDVNQTAPQRLKVLLACQSETAARAAAAEIAKIEALKPYTVDFEVRLSGQ
jgi:hypothetical protein